MIYLKSFLLVAVITLPLLAEPPVTPTPGEDRALTGGLSAAEFFAKRAQAVTCRNAWQARMNQSRTLKKELGALVVAKAPAGQLDPKEEAYVEYRRKELLDITEECGPCATQKIGRNGTWVISDGSCYLPGETEAERTAAFKAAIHMLSNTKLLARQRGGFESILDFTPINRRTGAFLPHAENVGPGSTIDTFIGVRGPGNVACQYLAEYKVEQKETAEGLKEFIITFKGLRQPDGFKPKVRDFTLAGTERKPSFQLALTEVMGMWYLRSDGYYRYHTSANFGLASIFAGPAQDREARSILIDTVLTLSERGR